MKEQDIVGALQSNPATSSIFVGCFPADRVPQQVDSVPAAFILNSDPAHKKGSHWVALFCGERVEFFDSFGRKPSYYGFNSPILDNAFSQSCQFQSDLSTVCGQYCMFFVHSRCSGLSFDQFLSKFSADCAKNDRLVVRRVNEIFDIKTELFDPDVLF